MIQAPVHPVFQAGCCSDVFAADELDTDGNNRFRELCRLMQSVFHFEYHDKLEALKNSYMPINPDRDTRAIEAESGDGDFAGQLEELLDKANYEKLSEAELAMAFEESSLFKIRLNVNFNDFSDVVIYTRGESLISEEQTSFFGLVSKTIEFSNFDRVVVFIKFASGVDQDKPGSTMLKMFQNVPKADIEMLFPNTTVGMRVIDKLMIGVPALVGGTAIFTTKMGASFVLLGTLIGYWLGIISEPVSLDQAALVALVASVGGIASYLFKQFSNFKNRKLAFMQTLTENLYFKNLDNNAGVFHRLIDEAEEEECKEAFLAYYFLLVKQDITDADTLDSAIESWFRASWDCDVDFEVDDALNKLRNLGLVFETPPALTAVDIERGCEILDKRWDDYFSYSPETTS
jgi:hypothetical protein